MLFASEECERIIISLGNVIFHTRTNKGYQSGTHKTPCLQDPETGHRSGSAQNVPPTRPGNRSPVGERTKRRPAYKTRKQVAGRGTHKTPCLQNPEKGRRSGNAQNAPTYKIRKQVAGRGTHKHPAYKTRKQVAGQGTHKTSHIEDPENDVVTNHAGNTSSHLVAFKQYTNSHCLLC